MALVSSSRVAGWRCKLRLLAEAFCPSPVSIFCHGRSFALQGFAGTYCDRCDSGHFGEECLACPGKGPGYVCSQRGTCSDGKAGDGNCTCVAPFKDTDRVTGVRGVCASFPHLNTLDNLPSLSTRRGTPRPHHDPGRSFLSLSTHNADSSRVPGGSHRREHAGGHSENHLENHKPQKGI